MEIKKQYLQKYLHLIAIEQIAEEYQQKGYEIFKNEILGNSYEADLVARKGNDTIVFEVKTDKLTSERKQKIKDLANYLRGQGNYNFLVVIATPPREKKMEVSDIEELLAQTILKEWPSELDELATHTKLRSVTDIDINEIFIKGAEIFVVGDGVVNVQLQIGSDGDQNRGDGLIFSDSFPFAFEITLEYDEKHNLKITEVDKLEVDTSSYYGNG